MTQEAVRFNREIADSGHLFTTFSIQDIAQRVYEYDMDQKEEEDAVRELMDRMTPLQLYLLAHLFDECAEGCHEPVAELAQDVVSDAHQSLVKIARKEEQLPEISGWMLESLNERRLKRNLLEFRLDKKVSLEARERLKEMPLDKQVETDQAIRSVLDRHQEEIQDLQARMADEMLDLLDLQPQA